jgi:hypothetical protein
VAQRDIENEDLREQIAAVERKNKMLNDKINEIIYNKATSYKEKTLDALRRNNDQVSPRGRRERAQQFGIGDMSDIRLNQVLADEVQNDKALDTFMRPPKQSPRGLLQARSATNFSVVQNLERLEVGNTITGSTRHDHTEISPHDRKDSPGRQPYHSNFAKSTMPTYQLPQPIDLERYQTQPTRNQGSPLRVKSSTRSPARQMSRAELGRTDLSAGR